MSEKIFAGEQFFHDDLFPKLELKGDAVSAAEYGPFDWKDLKCRMKIVGEIFGDGCRANAQGDAVVVTLKGSVDGVTYVDRASGTAAAGTGTDGDGKHIIASGTFLDYVEVDEAYKYGKAVVTVASGISGATLKVGFTAV